MTITFLFIIFLIQLSISHCLNESNEIRIFIGYSFKTNLVSFSGGLGTPEKIKFFFVDLSKEINLIFSNYGYNKDESMTMEISPSEYYMIENRYKAILASDYASFGLFNNRRLTFALVDEKIYHKDGVSAYIALGRSKKSFVFQLQESNLIKNRRIAFKSKELILGYNHDISSNHYCTTVPNGIRWSCLYKGLIISNNLHLNNTEPNSLDITNYQYYLSSVKDQLATFETFNKNIIAPYDVLEYLKKNYFNDLLRNKKCFLNETSNMNVNGKEEEVICHEDIISSLKNINFMLGEVMVGLNYSELFTKNDKHDTQLKFRIIFRNDIKDWTFGAGFVKRFHLIFDDDENWVGFPIERDSFKVSITNSATESDDDNTSIPILSIMIYNILIGLLTIGTCIIIYSKAYLKSMI